MPADEGVGGEDLSGKYHFTFDPNSEAASDAVVSSLSEAIDIDPDELERLESVVDPIVFDALVRRRRRPIQISFVYHDHHVTVDTSGGIRIQHSEKADQSTFEYTFDVDESPSHGVIRALSAVKGVEPTELSPLYGFIDPDALDAMFDDATESRVRDMCVSFRIDDLEVELSGDRHVTVRPLGATD